MFASNSRLYKAQGIILSRKNLGEADRLVTVFTKEFGKLRLMAKGIRKIQSRRAPHLEIFSRVALVINKGKTFDSITQVSPIYMHKEFSLEEISVAYFYCELINVLLPEHQEHADVFVLLDEALAQLSEQTMYLQSKNFALTLLRELGFLDNDKVLNGEKLQHFIENITERKLTTPKLIRTLL